METCTCGSYDLKPGEVSALPDRFLGKPVYAKLVDFGQLPDGGEKSILHSISDMEEFGIVYDRSWVEQNNGTRYVLNHPNTSDNAYWRTSVDATSLKMRVGSDRRQFTAVICIWFTKTTDAPAEDGITCTEILEIAERAEQKADAAQSRADAAYSLAQSADSTAQAGVAAAATAQSRADSAHALASTAQGRADAAWNHADAALSAANIAQATADQGLTLAANAVPKTGATATSNYLVNAVQSLSVLSLGNDSPNAINVATSGLLTINAEASGIEVSKTMLLTISATADTDLNWPASFTWRGEKGPASIASGTTLIVSVLFTGNRILAEVLHLFRPSIVVPPEPELNNILLTGQFGHIAYGDDPSDLTIRQLNAASVTSSMFSTRRDSDGMLIVTGGNGQVAWGTDPASFNLTGYGSSITGVFPICRQSDGMFLFTPYAGDKIFYGTDPVSFQTVATSLGALSASFCRQSDGVFFIGGKKGLFYGRYPWALDVKANFMSIMNITCRESDKMLLLTNAYQLYCGTEAENLTLVNGVTLNWSTCRQSDGLIIGVGGSYGNVIYGYDPASLSAKNYGELALYRATVRESDGMIIVIANNGWVIYGTDPSAMLMKQYASYSAFLSVTCRPADGMFIITTSDGSMLYGSDPEALMPIKLGTSNYLDTEFY